MAQKLQTAITFDRGLRLRRPKMKVVQNEVRKLWANMVEFFHCKDLP